MMSIRKPGDYHVKLYTGEWTIGRCERKEKRGLNQDHWWHIIGESAPFASVEMDVIGSRIEREG